MLKYYQHYRKSGEEEREASVEFCSQEKQLMTEFNFFFTRIFFCLILLHFLWSQWTDINYLDELVLLMHFKCIFRVVTHKSSHWCAKCWLSFFVSSFKSNIHILLLLRYDQEYTVWLPAGNKTLYYFKACFKTFTDFVFDVSSAEKRSCLEPVLWRSWTMLWLVQREQITAISLWMFWAYGPSSHFLWKPQRRWRKLVLQRKSMKVSL